MACAELNMLPFGANALNMGFCPITPPTPQEQWALNFAEALGSQPQITALIRASDAQTLADHNVMQFIDRPRWYQLPVIIPVGELDQFELGMVRTFRADLPGLSAGKKLRIFGRQSSANSVRVILLCRG